MVQSFCIIEEETHCGGSCLLVVANEISAFLGASFYVERKQDHSEKVLILVKNHNVTHTLILPLKAFI